MTIFRIDAYIITLALGTLLAISAGITAWFRRQAPGALPLLVLSAASAWWIGCELLSRIFETGSDRLIFFKLLFAGVVLSVPALLIFALQYTNRARWVTPGVLVLLSIEPVLFLVAVWTDRFHGLVFAGWQGRGSGQFTGGTLFWIHSVYSYGLAGLTQVLLIRGFFQAPALYRTQAAMMIFAALVPLLGNALTIFHLSPFPGRDLTPLGLVISSAMIAAALFQRGLLDLVPIARNAVVEMMNDGVLVLDSRNRVVDFNPAAQAILQLEYATMLGKPVALAMTALNDYVIDYDDVNGFHGEVPISGNRHLDLRISVLRDKHGLLRGRLIVLRDITVLNQTSAALQDANNRLRQQLSEIGEMQILLKEQAIRDPLTGLYNRRFLEETLIREISHAARVAASISVVIIDLDYFKRINDTHGHLAGDRVLHAMGELLRMRSRTDDAACRFGGEEFVVILPGATLDIAIERANAWRCEFMTTRIAFGEVELGTTFSAGVATYPAHGSDLASLMQAADVALYAAKSEGRNRVLAAQ